MRMNNVFLIGPPGAGKTTIGRGLARELGLNFLDTDQEIETRAGVDIAWIHDVEGEEGFAKREEKIISELSEQTGILLATGATAIHSSSNRRHLSARGTVVYLNVSIEAQLSRMERDKRRPLMQTNNKREVLEGIMQKTAHLYEEIADVTFVTEGQSIKVVIQQIVEKLRAL